MTTADKLLTQIKEDREIRAKSSQVVAWYPHRFDGTIRGPFNRWLTVSEVREEYKNNVASVGDDVEFFAHAANTWERKNRQLEIALHALQEIYEGETGRHEWNIVDEALANMEAVK